MSVNIGKHVVSAWLICLVAGIACLGVLAAYLSLTFTVPLAVVEPIEILDHTSTLELYPGQTVPIEVTLENHGELRYTVVFDFSLENETYQDNYVTTYGEANYVYPGIQNLTVYLSVTEDAPALNTMVDITARRIEGEEYVEGELEITSVTFTPNSIKVEANNAGVTPVITTEASVNGAIQTDVVPQLPVVLDINEEVILTLQFSPTLGNAYQITLRTSRDNLVHYNAICPEYWSAILYKANVNFYTIDSIDKIDIDVGNSGTSDTGIIAVYCGPTPGDMTEQTPTQPVPISLPAHSIVRVTINYDWTAGGIYYFKIITTTGQTLGEWPDQAPGQPVEKLAITNVEFIPGNLVNVTMQNIGNVSITVEKIRINQGSDLLSSDLIIAAGTQVEQQLSYAWIAGNFYQIKVETLVGLQYCYDTVAPTS